MLKKMRKSEMDSFPNEGRRMVRCPKCNTKHWVTEYQIDLVCKNCYTEDTFDNASMATRGWNLKAMNAHPKSRKTKKNTQIEDKVKNKYFKVRE